MDTNSETLTAPSAVVRPASLRRSWLFVSGIDENAQKVAMDSGADVIVADLEEFTAPADRPAARITITRFMKVCRARHVVGAVRVNKLDGDGLFDLSGVMPGAPVAIFLPHVESPDHIRRLDEELNKLEAQFGLVPGSTEIVPTIESARGVVAMPTILAASTRISACLLAAEDLSNDLGAIRGPDSIELQHVRSRFLVDCIGAGCVPIDLPFFHPDASAVTNDLAWAARVGFKSKCVVSPIQVAAAHAAFTPSDEDAQRAVECVRHWDGAVGLSQNETPPIKPLDYFNARRLLGRHAAFKAYEATLG